MTFSGEQFALHPEEVPEIGLQLSRDFLGWTYHGLYMTHLDALSHVFFRGQMYNKKSSQLVTTAEGATIQSVEEAGTGVVSRGILADVAKYRGVPWLEAGDAIGPDELKAVLESEGIQPEPGDVLIVRSGFWGKRKAQGPTAVGDGFPGLHASCAPLLREWDIALLAGDSVNDVLPSGFNVMQFPIHEIGQVGMGLWLLDNCDLEDLSHACASRSRYEFFFSIAPLPNIRPGEDANSDRAEQCSGGEARGMGIIPYSEKSNCEIDRERSCSYEKPFARRRFNLL